MSLEARYRDIWMSKVQRSCDITICAIQLFVLKIAYCFYGPSVPLIFVLLFDGGVHFELSTLKPAPRTHEHGGNYFWCNGPILSQS